MSANRIHLHRREFVFLGWIGATLVLIAGYLIGGQALVEQQGSGWRRIDIKALQQRIDSGDLGEREAAWYRPVEHKQPRSPP